MKCIVSCIELLFTKMTSPFALHGLVQCLDGALASFFVEFSNQTLSRTIAPKVKQRLKVTETK